MSPLNQIRFNSEAIVRLSLAGKFDKASFAFKGLLRGVGQLFNS